MWSQNCDDCGPERLVLWVATLMRAQIKSWTVLAYDFLSPKNQGKLIVVSGQVSCHLTGYRPHL
jgi:hypothetical protein